MRRILFFVVLLAGIALLSACEVPTEFTVNSTFDVADAVPGDGVCETNVEDQCTLRAAVMEANALGTPVTIALAGAQTYTIQHSAADDDAAVVGDLDITGRVTLQGNGATISTTSPNRTVDVFGDLTMVDLRLTGAFGGGALRNQGQARLVGATVDGNLHDPGGAIEQAAGTLVLEGTYVRGNATSGVQVTGGTAIVIDSSIHRNGAYLFGGEAAILQQGGDLLVINSTIGEQDFDDVIFRCFPVGCGPVPYSINAPGLKQTGGSARVVRSTIAGNTVGIAATGSVTLHGTVVAGNLTDCSAPVVSQGYNLDEDGTCLTASTTGDLPSTASGLGAFTAPGVVIPPAGSALLDQVPVGTPYLCDDQHPVDQRGLPRPAGTACDIGAIERQPTDP